MRRSDRCRSHEHPQFRERSQPLRASRQRGQSGEGMQRCSTGRRKHQSASRWLHRQTKVLVHRRAVSGTTKRFGQERKDRDGTLGRVVARVASDDHVRPALGELAHDLTGRLHADATVGKHRNTTPCRFQLRLRRPVGHKIGKGVVRPIPRSGRIEIHHERRIPRHGKPDRGENTQKVVRRGPERNDRHGNLLATEGSAGNVSGRGTRLKRLEPEVPAFPSRPLRGVPIQSPL